MRLIFPLISSYHLVRQPFPKCGVPVGLVSRMLIAKNVKGIVTFHDLQVALGNLSDLSSSSSASSLNLHWTMVSPLWKLSRTPIFPSMIFFLRLSLPEPATIENCSVHRRGKAVRTIFCLASFIRTFQELSKYGSTKPGKGVSLESSTHALNKL